MYIIIILIFEKKNTFDLDQYSCLALCFMLFQLRFTYVQSTYYLPSSIYDYYTHIIVFKNLIRKLLTFCIDVEI